MTAVVLDGRALAATYLAATQSGVAELVGTHGRAPALATVVVGDDPASHTYVGMKAARCAKAGIVTRKVELAAEVSTTDLVGVLAELSADPNVDGVLLQHPLPPHIDERMAFEAITPSKDVDGVTWTSFAAMAFAACGFKSAAPGGILALLDAYEIDVSGKHVVVVGNSAILGKPVGMLLLARTATVTFCQPSTPKLAEHVASADIVVATAGSPRSIRGEWIKPGAVVIDAGYTDNVGDVDYESACLRASYITPVPGGVGPMTIAVLLAQTLEAAKKRKAAM